MSHFSNIQSPSISVAIVCYHTEIKQLVSLLNSLSDCINELRKIKFIEKTRVFLIDNSENGTVSKNELESFYTQYSNKFFQISLVNGHGNVGYGCGHNLVLASLDSDYHLILNPDVELDNQALKVGLTRLSNDGETVLASPFALDLYNERQFLCKRYPAIFTLFVRGFLPFTAQKFFNKRLSSYEMREMQSLDHIDAVERYVSIVSGCFMLCRTSALKKVGGFDKRFFLYFEDFDLSLRMSKIGKLVYLPEMKIVHCGGNTAKKGFSHILMFIHSGIKFYNTHGWRWFKQ